MAKQTKIQTPFSLKANFSVIAAVFSTITNLFAGNPHPIIVPVSRNTQGVFTSLLVFSGGFWGVGGWGGPPAPALSHY